MAFWKLFGRRQSKPDLGDLAEIASPHERLERLIERFDLQRVAPAIRSHAHPATGFRLARREPGRSRFGGAPELPDDIAWPEHRGRPLTFLLQIDLEEASAADLWQGLPAGGCLSFFYDLKEQPWGFDPLDSTASRVLYTPPGTRTTPTDPPDASVALDPFAIEFFPLMTLPQGESTAYDEFEAMAGMNAKEADRYHDLIDALDTLGYGSADAAHHRLGGHSENIQGDMQFEAELVRHGFNTGDGTSYEDPKALDHRPGAKNWRLLLQLDSEEEAGLTWGDLGMLYFWVREDDAQNGDWSKTWTGLQCG